MSSSSQGVKGTLYLEGIFQSLGQQVKPIHTRQERKKVYFAFLRETIVQQWQQNISKMQKREQDKVGVHSH